MFAVGCLALSEKIRAGLLFIKFALPTAYRGYKNKAPVAFRQLLILSSSRRALQ